VGVLDLARKSKDVGAGFEGCRLGVRGFEVLEDEGDDQLMSSRSSMMGMAAS
jgi:hypothetical protein